MRERIHKAFYAAVTITAAAITIALVLHMTVFSGERASGTGETPAGDISPEETGAAAGESASGEGEREENTDPEMAGIAFELEITEEQGAALVESAFGESFPVSDIRLEFGEDREITAYGRVSKAFISNTLEESGTGIPALFRAALYFLPDELDVSFVFLIEADPNEGAVRIDTREVEVQGFPVDAGLLPAEVESGINNAINGPVRSCGGKITEIRTSDGVMYIKGNLN